MRDRQAIKKKDNQFLEMFFSIGGHRKEIKEVV